jgi:hypothetical protein
MSVPRISKIFAIIPVQQDTADYPLNGKTADIKKIAALAMIRRKRNADAYCHRWRKGI